MAATRRWTLFIAGFVLIAVGFQAVWPWMIGIDAIPAGSVVQAVHPAQAAIGMLAVSCMAVLIAIGIARQVTLMSGLAVFGAALGWASLDLANPYTVLVHGEIKMQAADGMAWSLLVLLAAWLAMRYGRVVEDVHPVVDGAPPDPLRSRDALALLVSGSAALPVVWFVASTPLRGQAVCAAVVGGMAAGLVGRLWSPHVQPILAPAGVVLAGTIGSWICGSLLPSDVAAAWARGDIPNLLMLTPIDWAVGGLLGVPIGYKIAGSFLGHESVAEAG